MKSPSLVSAIAIAFTLGLMSFKSNPLHDETSTFKVSGNCEMCKKRIESAMKKPGVKSANWDVKSKTATVTYDVHSTNADDIQKSIAEAGYDTEKVKATEKAYKALPGCCQYDR